MALGQVPDPARRQGHGLTAHGDAPGGHRQDPGQGTQQGRFSATVGPGQGDQGRWGKMGLQALHGGAAAAQDGDPFEA